MQKSRPHITTSCIRTCHGAAYFFVVPPRIIHPHVRHSVAEELLSSDCQIVTVQDLCQFLHSRGYLFFFLGVAICFQFIAHRINMRYENFLRSRIRSLAESRPATAFLQHRAHRLLRLLLLDMCARVTKQYVNTRIRNAPTEEGKRKVLLETLNLIFNLDMNSIFFWSYTLHVLIGMYPHHPFAWKSCFLSQVDAKYSKYSESLSEEDMRLLPYVNPTGSPNSGVFVLNCRLVPFFHLVLDYLGVSLHFNACAAVGTP